MARLPQPGADNGTWGGILNEFLGIEHNPDGTLKATGSLAGKADDTLVVHKAGDTITGALGITYDAGSTDLVTWNKQTADAFYRYAALANGKSQVMAPWAPLGWGTHVAGSAGSGSDFQHRIEGINDVAHLFQLSHTKWRVNDGTNYTSITVYQAPPWNNITLSVSSTTGFASSGTANAILGTNSSGTFTYTSKDATHFYNVTSSGISAPSDTSERYSLWIEDSFGAPILWVGSTNGLRVNDTIKFAAAGVFSDNTNDIIIGYDDHAARTGHAIKFGADANVKIQRGNDGFGNNQFKMVADGLTLTWTAAGLYPSGDMLRNLGTTSNRWANFYGNRTVVGNGSQTLPSMTFQSATDTGWYLNAAGDARLTIAGTDAIQATASDLIFTGTTIGVNGSSVGIGYATVVGVDRLLFRAGSAARWLINASGQFLPNTNGSYDIGSTTNYARDIFLKRATITGNTGAASQVRIIGSNATGAPASGTWTTGDLATAQDGHVYICTSGGTPGTWADVGNSSLNSLLTNTGDIVYASAANTPARLGTGSAGTALVSDGTRPVWDHDWVTDRASLPAAATAHNFSRWLGGEGAASGPASGTPMMNLIGLNKGQVVTSISFYSSTTALVAGVSPHLWGFICNTSGTVLAVTADDTSPVWGASTKHTFTLTSPYTIPTGGQYYVGFCFAFSSGGTVPNLTGNTKTTTTVSQIPPFISANGDAGHTTPPNPGDTIPVSTVRSSQPYCFIS